MVRASASPLLIFAGIVALFAASAVASTQKEWAKRTIYQVLTDRFATSDGSSPSCSLSRYCGGTWRGLQKRLDYIAGMGFDSIWISPVVDNYEDSNQFGYHGYWARDFSALNSHFGSAADLESLLADMHSRGMLLMIDVVANHPGPVGHDYKTILPFNKAEYYHDCNGCPSSCNIEHWQNQPEVEHCRLSGLPDLNQSVPFVRQQLISLIKSTVVRHCDGLRVDTVPEVEKPFWAELQDSVGMFAMGEVYDMRTDYVAGYQGPLDSVLSYPMFNTLRDVFGHGGSMRLLGSCLEGYKKVFSNTHVLGNFIDNHDQQRFLNYQKDSWKYKNALAWVLFSEGIPIVYYGTEQGFSGGNDPANREPLWPTGYKTDTDLYKFLSTSIAFRKKAAVWGADQIERWQDESFYAFTRGTTLVALTNVGANSGDVTRTITYHPYKVGTRLCNIYWPNDDCITVTSQGITVGLLHGEPKVYTPSA